MRWIDIDLTGPADRAEAAPHLEAAAARYRQLPALQERDGTDSSTAVSLMAEVGRLLFRAVTAVDPVAFSADRAHEGGVDPHVGVAETDHLTGYHLVVFPEHLTLPWTWLHNGVDFLLVRYPIAASLGGSRATAAAALGGTAGARAWMARHRDALFTQNALGARPLTAWLEHLRCAEAGDPEILFLAGHCEESVRPLLYREADAIRHALAASALQRPLARLAVPEQAVTPDQVRRRGGAYQGFHFAGPTARPPAARIETAWEYLAALGAASGAPPGESGDGAPGRTGLPPGAAPEPVSGLGDYDCVGVDPITSILDELSELAARREELNAPWARDARTAAAEATASAPEGSTLEPDQEALAGVTAGGDPHHPRRLSAAGETAAAGDAGRAGARQAAAGPPWLLEDGPIHPEELARVGGAPPLVFSNSYLSLPDLGPRFLEAGASVFVGPTAAVMSQPAREFAARFYGCLSDGYCAAAALRSAALACRERHGAESPVWLSYGLIGFGSLALQYL